LADEGEGEGDGERGDRVAREWHAVGSFPTGEASGTYTPLAWVDD
jgi:hypothetical protein